jgi:hypothetical protein
MKAKYGKRLLRQCQAVFNLLPLATCINHSVLVVHGGLPGQDGVTLDDIRAINRNRWVVGGLGLQILGLVGGADEGRVEARGGPRTAQCKWVVGEARGCEQPNGDVTPFGCLACLIMR